MFQSSNSKAVILVSMDVPRRNTEPNVNSIPYFIHTFSGVINSTKSAVAYLATYFDVLMVRIYIYVYMYVFFLNLDIQIYIRHFKSAKFKACR